MQQKISMSETNQKGESIKHKSVEENKTGIDMTNKVDGRLSIRRFTLGEGLCKEGSECHLYKQYQFGI